MSNILYLCSEVFPLIKTGGLADVAASLPAALIKQSHDVRILLPAYKGTLNNTAKGKLVAQSKYYNQQVNIIETRLPGSRIIIWLVDCPALFDRPGGPYTDLHNEVWHDNALRFATFCKVAVDISLNRLNLNWKTDIVHCNDWQTGLVPALLSLHKKRPASIFTIHNLAYQGLFNEETYTDLQLPAELWNMHGLEFYGQLSFIKGGLTYADKITTVSPTYAQEILHPDYGCGLNELLQHRQTDLSGILNGIDNKYWNPGTDKHLFQKYNRRTLDKKYLNKTELQKQLSLPINKSIPMLGMVSRLVEQKGLDIILHSMKTLCQMPLQVIILGTGETHYELQLCQWAEKHPDRVKVIPGYDESLAHKIEAACDMYLMPSTFEPCGLNQLYSLCYGTLPIVTPVGGLVDSVVNTNEASIKDKTANGFVMEDKTSLALIESIQHALLLYFQPDAWRQLQLTAMSGDYSWKSSALKYSQLYAEVLTDR